MAKKAIEIWKDKLEVLQREEAITADASIKFDLKERIKEAKEKIAQLEQEEKAKDQPVADSLAKGSQNSDPKQQFIFPTTFQNYLSNLDQNPLLNWKADLPVRGLFPKLDPSIPRARRIFTFNLPDKVHSVAFSPDNRKLATGIWDVVWIWDMATKREIQSIKGHKGPAYEYVGYSFKLIGKTCQFSPYGESLATGSSKDEVLLWDIETSQVIRQMEGHKGLVLDLVFSPDGWRLASASRDGIAKVWKTDSGYEEFDLWGHGDDVNCIAYSVKGDLIATGSDDKTVRLWNAYTGSEKKVIKGFNYGVTALAFSPDGVLLVTASPGDGIKLWDYASITVKHQFDGGWRCVAFSPDGKLLAYEDEEKIHLWNIEKAALHQTLNGHNANITCLAFSPSGKFLASGSEDRKVMLWEFDAL